MNSQSIVIHPLHPPKVKAAEKLEPKESSSADIKTSASVNQSKEAAALTEFLRSASESPAGSE
jgi:hypothetical protein